jgi:hypothetical protein
VLDLVSMFSFPPPQVARVDERHTARTNLQGMTFGQLAELFRADLASFAALAPANGSSRRLAPDGGYPRARPSCAPVADPKSPLPDTPTLAPQFANFRVVVAVQAEACICQFARVAASPSVSTKRLQFPPSKTISSRQSPRLKRDTLAPSYSIRTGRGTRPSHHFRHAVNNSLTRSDALINTQTRCFDTAMLTSCRQHSSSHG